MREAGGREESQDLSEIGAGMSDGRWSSPSLETQNTKQLNISCPPIVYCFLPQDKITDDN